MKKIINIIIDTALYSLAIVLIILLVLTLTSFEATYQTRDIKGIIVQQEEEVNYTRIFTIATGNKNNNIKYYFYIRENEGYKLQSIDADYLEIVETDNIKPCIKGRFQSYNSNILSSENYIIYVPENTITIDYSIDLEKELNK